MGMFDKSRIRIASKFGRLEHRFGEMTGLLLGINYFVIMGYRNIWAGVMFASWIIYFVSHRLEKAFYPRNFRF